MGYTNTTVEADSISGGGLEKTLRAGHFAVTAEALTLPDLVMYK